MFLRLVKQTEAKSTCYFVGSESDVSEMIQRYLKEIEELRAKLLESEAMCQQLRKTSLRTPPRGLHNSHVAMTGELETCCKVKSNDAIRTDGHS
jgi:hypothetical protein